MSKLAVPLALAVVLAGAVPASAASADPGDVGTPPNPTIVTEPQEPVVQPETTDVVMAPDDPPATTPAFQDSVLSASAGTSGPTVIGVTWTSGTATPGTTVEVRTRSGDVWSTWYELDVEGSLGEAVPGQRDGTAPYTAVGIEAVEARLTALDGVPDDVTLSVIAAPEDAADEPTASGGGESGEGVVLARQVAIRPPFTPASSRGATESAIARQSAFGGVSNVLPLASPVPMPTIHSRSAWGADESIMTWTPQTGRALGTVIHHTAGTNDYTQAQVPALLRGIYQYHAITRGWGDIGYNFLIDKFGRVWEGRSGGIDRAIIGGHAVGWNAVTFGVSFMGNFETATVPQAMLTSAEQVIAWKFGIHGVTVDATVTANGTTAPAISGHRDVASTACPGRNLYPLLGQIRAAVRQRLAAVPEVPADYSRNLVGGAHADLAVLSDGPSIQLATSTAEAWKPTVQVGTGWNGPRTFGAGDWTGDGVPDLIMIDTTERVWLYPGTRAGGWATRVQIGSGWQVMDLVTAGFDWDGDGRPDLLAREKATGKLFLYPGNGAAGFQPRRQIGTGWQIMDQIALIGPLDDGAPALVAQSGGTLWLYRGDGKGGFPASTRSTLSSDWAAMTATVGAGDLNGDGKADLVVRGPRGELYLYPGNGDGTLRGRSQIGSGWQVFGGVTASVVKGTGVIYGARTDGALLRYEYEGTGNFGRLVDSGVRAATDAAERWLPPSVVGEGWNGPRTVGAGDWTGDGVADLIMIDTSEQVWLYPGTAAGGWSPRVRIGSGWQVMDLVTAGFDWDGDGWPDLIAREGASGDLYLYPGNGSAGFRPRRLIGTGWNVMDSIALIGTLDGGVPGLVARSGSVVYTYRGDGKGGFPASPRTVTGSGWPSTNALLGVGDVTGDAYVDLVVRRVDGSLHLYPGGPGGTFGSPTLIGTGWQSFTGVSATTRRGNGVTIHAVRPGDGGLVRYVYQGPVSRVIVPGDWDNDGVPDLMTVRANGDLMLHRGVGGGSYASTGVRLGTGWGAMTHVVAGGDWTGNGHATMVAFEPASRTIWLYPANGTGGFMTRVALATGVSGVDQLVAAGRFSGGRQPDLLTRDSATGSLQLRKNTGSQSLGAPTTISGGWNSYAQIVGVGDVDGDGLPDVVGKRASDGGLELRSGNGRGGFFGNRPFGALSRAAVIS